MRICGLTRVSALFATGIVGSALPLIGQPRVSLAIQEIQPGQPDLVVAVSAHRGEDPALPLAGAFDIYTGEADDGVVVEDSVITITVQNQLLTPKRFYLREATQPPTFVVLGGEAQNVMVTIELDANLRLLRDNSGEFVFFSDFPQCTTDPAELNIWCWGATIAAGGSARIVLAVGAFYACGLGAPVDVEVDPYAWIGEVDENNNKASTTIYISSPC